jgi:hypothetical protein
MIKKYLSKPVVIEAMQWDGTFDGMVPIANWSEHRVFLDAHEPLLIINTPEGTMSGSKGVWIIKGTIGEFYPCKDEVFRKKYELVEGEG